MCIYSKTRQCVGSISTLVTRQSAMLSSPTQHAMPPEFSGKWGTKVSQREHSVLTLGSQVPYNIYIKLHHQEILSISTSLLPLDIFWSAKHITSNKSNIREGYFILPLSHLYETSFISGITLYITKFKIFSYKIMYF